MIPTEPRTVESTMINVRWATDKPPLFDVFVFEVEDGPTGPIEVVAIVVDGMEDIVGYIISSVVVDNDDDEADAEVDVSVVAIECDSCEDDLAKIPGVEEDVVLWPGSISSIFPSDTLEAGNALADTRSARLNTQKATLNSVPLISNLAPPNSNGTEKRRRL